MSSLERKTLFFLARLFLYFVLILGFILCQWQLAKVYHGDLFLEYGVVENIQLGILIFCGLFFALQAKLNKAHRALTLFLASLCVFGAIRELDSFFEQTLPFVDWKFGYIFPVLAIAYCIKHRQQALNSFFLFTRSSAFDLMFLAVLIGLPIAQAYGHKAFIEDVLGTDIKAMPIRRLIEEGLESVGYFILLLSSFEYFYVFRHNHGKIKD